MIGNDIVAVQQGKSFRRLEQYMRRICEDSEKTLQIDLHPAMLLALTWSIKEAAFKYCRRSYDIKFYPKKFQISRIKGLELLQSKKWNRSPKIQHRGFADLPHLNIQIESEFGTLLGKTIGCENYIHSIVSQDKDCFSAVHWGIVEIGSPLYKHQSRAVRIHALRHFKNFTNQSGPEGFEFIKNENNVPVLYINGQQSPLAFSFSHHDQFVAYAWC
ncbi:MAG: hypothetical protein DHS20C18_22720 [Saprospiraceae bacterium]|nr:MAG: hypothetical protein DHS20C18_22720 [Saprospiraceae bacterium]